MGVALAPDRFTIRRAIIFGGAIIAVACALAYQLWVSEFGSPSPSLGNPEWDRAAFEGDLLSNFLPVTSCLVLLLWGLFQARPSFVAAIVGALAFAVFTGCATLFIQLDTRVLRMIGFIFVVAPGQMGIVALAFGAALLGRWSYRKHRKEQPQPTTDAHATP